MEKILSVAKAHYEAGSQRAKDLAHQFFDKMDEDRDGQVNIDEFMEFMAEEGHEGMGEPRFFDFLDRDGNGALDFWEVMTLYYIIKSGRPFCGSCKTFLTDVYFACVECYESRRRPYCLCIRCYRNFNRYHDHNRNHNHPPRFLDNYTLLEAKRITDMNQPIPAPMRRTQTISNANAVVRYTSGQNLNYAPPSSSSSNAIVPARTSNNNFNRWRAAFRAFETAVSIASLGVGLSACSIM